VIVVTEGIGTNMNIYLLSQDVNRGYDTYDSAIVVAETEGEARTYHPGGSRLHNGTSWVWESDGSLYDPYDTSGDWVNSKQIDRLFVEKIGVANDNQERGVVLASFNAG